MKSEATENLEVIIERLTNFQQANAEDHSAILEQVKRTNGSVADIQRWRYMITGALIIMNIIIMPVAIAIITKFLINNLF
jgi:hypothetical protein